MSGPETPDGGQKWRLAKVGAAMVCLSLIFYGFGIYIAMKIGSKFVPFAKFIDYLAVVGFALITWNVYNVHLRKYFRK